MSKKVKALVQKELEARFADVEECLVVSLRGVAGVENNEMRAALSEKGIRLTVVKNSLARRAFENLGRGGIGELLTGPCAIAYGGDSIVDVAKELIEWGKKLEPLVIKGGYLDGKALEAEQAQALAKMPSRAELQASLVNLALSPGGRVVSTALAPGARVAGCLEALIKKLEAA